MSFKLAVVVNKRGGELAPSETFLHAHINQMPCKVYSLIGNPGFRVKREGSVGRGVYAAPRDVFSLALRWGKRRLLGESVAQQDTRAIVRFLRAEGISAVLAEYGPTAVSVMTACREAGVPLISQFHGYDAYREPLLLKLGAQYRELFSVSAAIVGVSEHMCEQLISLGAPREKVFHNACGAEVAQPQELASVSSRCGKERFVMVGRLVEKKAPFISLLAFSMLVKDVPDAELEIIGDGPLMGPCLQLAKALCIEERVIFSGAQSHDFVMKALGRSTCFIQHSVRAPDGDMEGTPVGVLEAMGMGLAVVATRHGGIQDIVEQGVTGLLVDEYDVAGMHLAMREVARSPEYASALGARARSAVLENWTSERSIGRLWEIIQNSC